MTDDKKTITADDIKFDPRNYRLHPDKNKKLIRKSVRDNKMGRSMLMDNENTLIAGNGVFEAVKAEKIPVRVIETDGTEAIVIKRTDLSSSDPVRKKLAVMDNSTTDTSGFDYDMIQADFDDDQCIEMGIDMRKPADKESAAETEARATLADAFLVPPVSVLDSRKGDWQKRKRAWLTINGDDGRSRDNILGSLHQIDSENYGKTFKSMSIFDPVLAEIINKWFLPTEQAQCKVCDPFAGGMFGFVCSYLGHEFTGIELRAEQADINNDNIKAYPQSRYVCDDGQNIAKHLSVDSQDMIFSCPPYFDLEKYSDDPKDASAQKSYEDFRQILDNAFTGAAACLKNNRFAVVVMSNVRNKTDGGYYDICGDITQIMAKNGLSLYNEFILVNTVGTGAIRARGYMKYRKAARCHQEILVFYKGDNPKNISNDFKDIEIAEIEQPKEGDNGDE